MESTEFYDIRGPEVPSGIFDLRRWSPTIRTSLVKAARTRTQGKAPDVQLDKHGFAYCREPVGGPNPQWAKMIFTFQETLEMALRTTMPMMIKVERVYRIDFGAFQPKDWKQLMILFSRMPGWIGVKPYPRWYGERAGPPPKLWAAVGKEGLRATGILSEVEWARWDLWFQDNIHIVPLQRVS